jgi:hypothetical protein
MMSVILVVSQFRYKVRERLKWGSMCNWQATRYDGKARDMRCLANTATSGATSKRKEGVTASSNWKREKTGIIHK